MAALFFAWVAWLGNWWVALFIVLLFDIYITGYIPLTWWKKSPNHMVRSIMSWVDAIVYALVLVYFVFTFIGQNYRSPRRRSKRPFSPATTCGSTKWPTARVCR